MAGLTVRAIRAQHLADNRTAYWVTLDGPGEQSVVIDETSGVLVVERDDLAAQVGKPAAALISRLIVRQHEGEEIDWPQEIAI